MPHKMDIVKKLHQQFVVDHLQNGMWQHNPLVVELDTTEVCNFACPGCISEDLIVGRTSFTKERLMNLARELYEFGVKAVILIGGGEPLAHPSAGELGCVHTKESIIMAKRIKPAKTISSLS